MRSILLIPPIDDFAVFTDAFLIFIVDFVNYCQYPYTYKGWGDDGEPGNQDVVFGDCTLNILDAYPSSSSMRLIVYPFMTFILLCLALRNSNTKVSLFCLTSSKIWGMEYRSQFSIPQLAQPIALLNSSLRFAKLIAAQQEARREEKGRDYDLGEDCSHDHFSLS